MSVYCPNCGRKGAYKLEDSMSCSCLKCGCDFTIDHIKQFSKNLGGSK